MTSSSAARHILALHRRGLLRGSLGLAALAAVQPPPAPARAQAPGAGLGHRWPFTLGVASGDPWPDGVVIWTRLAPEPFAPLGGMPQAAAVEVLWEVAEDEGFARVARSGAALARPELGFAVHVEVGGLAPGRPYWYRFRAAGEASPVGRTRTAPAPGAAVPRLRFVNAGCQHFEHGHFTAWRHVAEEPELDLVVHYGDYIYEYRGARPGGPPGWGPAVRAHEGDETITLDDYRRRHAQYRMDPDLAAAHAAHPFLVSFDDHEVDNNWAGLVSEEDGGRRFPVAVPPEVFALRVQAALQAWYEHMPLRRSALPRGPAILAHRRIRWGRLAEIHVLDTRQHRDDQPCGDGIREPCAEVARPDAQMLGAAQERWLLDGLAASDATWQVLAQQVVVMPLVSPGGTVGLDSWGGYPAARARLLAGMAERRVANPVVLTGDLHHAMAGTLHAVPGDPGSPAVATEFVATSISSGGDGSEQTPRLAAALPLNPHIAFLNSRRGYCLHEATPGRMEVAFRAVSAVTRPGAPREDRGRLVVEAGRPGPQAA
jgi:alkaline phosphatase D